MVVTIHCFCLVFGEDQLEKYMVLYPGCVNTSRQCNDDDILYTHCLLEQYMISYWLNLTDGRIGLLHGLTIHGFILLRLSFLTPIGTMYCWFFCIYFQQKTKQQHPSTLWICLQNSPSQISMTWHIQDHDDITIMRLCICENGEDQTTSPLQIIRGAATAHAAGIAQRMTLPSLSVTQQL